MSLHNPVTWPNYYTLLRHDRHNKCWEPEFGTYSLEEAHSELLDKIEGIDYTVIITGDLQYEIDRGVRDFNRSQGLTWPRA